MMIKHRNWRRKSGIVFSSKFIAFSQSVHLIMLSTEIVCSCYKAMSGEVNIDKVGTISI